ncbi:Solute carrier family 28 member 3-like 2 [Homarus americanus]|uniref:Sodium/nucleoside cotransporter n=1 Tax=Homarus americanus TaxID=6706 RepID=A0A8J5MXJ0_HOMAM|nr:Solute carrier family 28 member 3-like 2 [Homarus americanus]
MSGLDNPGFMKDGNEKNDVVVPVGNGLDKPVSLENKNDKPNDYSMRVVVGAETQYPPGDNYGNFYPGHNDEVDTRQPPAEEDDEDNNILTFLPCYHDMKKRMNSVNQDGKVKVWVRRLVVSVLATLYVAYFIAVLSIHTKIQEEDYWCRGDGFLIILTGIVGLGLLYFQVVKPLWGAILYKNFIKKLVVLGGQFWQHRWVRLLVYLCLVGAVVIFLLVDAKEEPHRLISVFGIAIRWRHVAWGMGLQFLLGLVILRWPLGQAVFQCAGDKVSTFLAFTDAGSGFVFGALVSEQHIFAFQVLSVILFFSFCIQILYYFGVMQWVVLKLGWFLQVTVGTTACESVNAAANIFLGQTEAPLLIKPFIPDMTKSELHAVMTGGFATIAGSVLAAYISFGVDPAHLLSASVMSAPAALAFAKLFYPETKQSRTGVKDIKIEKGDEANCLHAAMVGVTNAIPLVANIAANLIAFYAFIALLSSIFDWSCTLAGAEAGFCSLQGLFGWIFMPLAWVMGVDWSECDKVGELIGIKTIVNEFVAYARLAEMKNAGDLSVRAEVIATYALCGFSNISSIGINLGGFGAMAPGRKADLAKVVVRAMIAGSCACFLTACIAGTLLNEIDNSSSSSVTNVTELSTLST